MVSKKVPIGTDGVKEPLVNSTWKLNTIAANQEGVLILTIMLNASRTPNYSSKTFD